jgi:hypothetical protein
MYYYPFQYHNYPPPTWYFRTYPPVDVKIFSSSVNSFRLLIQQGSLLLDRLGDPGFAHKLMDAAQRGNKKEVDRLIQSIGLKIPVATRYTPTGVIFELSTQSNPQQPVSCCTLMLTMKWR